MIVIDVSKHQGIIDWAKAFDSGVRQVFIKVTEGVGYIDPNAVRNSDGAFKANIQVGYYHFASLNDKEEVQDAEKEAKCFLDALKPLAPNSLPIVLDLETNAAKLTKDEVLAWIKAFFKALEAAGHKDYMLYSYEPFLKANLPDNHGLGNIPLWIAAYTNKPNIPKGWKNYKLWQYSSEGKVAGINGNVDLNQYAV